MQPIQTVPITEYFQNMIDFHNRIGYTEDHPEPDYMKVDSEEQLEGCIKKIIHQKLLPMPMIVF